MRRLFVCLIVGCASPAVSLPVEPRVAPVVTPPTTAPESVVMAATWAKFAQSPLPTTPLACGVGDEAITRVATAAAEVRAAGGASPDPDWIALALRAEGEPHLNPRVLTAVAAAPSELEDQLRALRGSFTRCGVAEARARDGGVVTVAIAVDALAELSPLPMRARTGQWLSFEARLATPATHARLVVLGSRGAPRTVPTSIDGKKVTARFVLDRPGAFLVQLVVDLASGPKPLLEARIFSDVDPPSTVEAERAPGEERSDLASMVASLREAEALIALVDDPALDTLAMKHAQRMRDAHRVAHDLGDGDLVNRFAEAGLPARVVGENVAHAASIARAHRTLYSSASHRLNLLRADYTHLGTGAVRDEDGSFWVCEVFAAR